MRYLFGVVLLIGSLFLSDSCKKDNDAEDEVVIGSVFVLYSDSFFIDIDKNGSNDIIIYHIGRSGHFYAQFVTSLKIINSDFNVHIITQADTLCQDTTFRTATQGGPPGIDTTITCRECELNENYDFISSSYTTVKLFSSLSLSEIVAFNPNQSDSLRIRRFSEASLPYPTTGVHWKCSIGNNMDPSINYVLLKKIDNRKWRMKIEYDNSRHLIIYSPVSI
jgi:hypothetical protein